MTLTLLALFMAPICLLMVLAPKQMHRILKEWAASPAMLFLSSLFIFLFALLIVISTGFNLKFWEDGWDAQIVLSWVAVLSYVKGLAHFFPKVASWKIKTLTEARLPAMGFVGLLFCLGLVYLETQVF